MRVPLPEVLSAVDADALVADLQEVVGLAPVGGTPGEVAVQDWCAQRLAVLGAEVDRWEVDVAQARRQPGFPGTEVERDRAVGVVGTWGGGAPDLILCGHTDVVPTGDLAAWSGDPFTLRRLGDRLVGRGSCDMLGGVVAGLAAVRTVTEGGYEPSLAFHAVSAEEDGGLGAWATLRRGHRGRACVIAEPTGGQTVVANGGSLTFRLEVPGRAAHGSARRLGESAVDRIPLLLTALRQLEATRNLDPDAVMAAVALPYPISVGKVQAGDWASTVPDRAVLEGRYGVQLGEDIADAQRDFEEAIAAASSDDRWLRDHPVTVTWPGGMFASGRLPAGDPLADEVARAAATAGLPVARQAAAAYGSDLRHYAAAGIPTLQFGPGDVAVAHSADEWVDLADLVGHARAYAALLVARCS